MKGECQCRDEAMVPQTVVFRFSTKEKLILKWSATDGVNSLFLNCHQCSQGIIDVCLALELRTDHVDDASPIGSVRHTSRQRPEMS